MKTLLSTAVIITTFLIAATSPPLLVAALGSSSTIAVTYGGNSNTVCGIIAGEPTQRIQCIKDDGRTISIQPNVSFESISGGRGLLCGLRSGGFSLFCWNTTTFLPKRIYHSYSVPLTGLTVGDSHVCAVQSGDGVAICWRFPSPEVTWKFRAITSGVGFSCGILKYNSRIKCWGVNEIGNETERQFGNLTILSLYAGESHVCGITKNGTLICKGSNVPSHMEFQFSILALGSNHSSGIQRKNGLVISWGGGSKNLEIGPKFLKSVSFETIQSGLDFTCGLTTMNLSVICWGTGWKTGLVLENSIPLPMVIPGPCVQSSCSICGVYPNSDSLCAGTERICRSCDTQLPIPALLPPLPSLSSPLSHTLHPRSRAENRILAFSIVGSVGAFAGLCSIIFCFWKGGVFGLQPGKSTNMRSTLAVNNGYNLPPSTSVSSENENSLNLSRHRSGSSSKHIDRAEHFSLSELVTATNGFLLENKIGGGSFGTVYKGKLEDGRVVAIKRGEIESTTKKFREKESAFDSEVALLSRLHHKHLVELVGFCQEHNERLLVYEYMSNGSLFDHLHSKNNVGKNSSMLNSWRMRIKIALDAARGIEYFHNYSAPPIIHRDIKSSNILLDKNYTAKVSDFGLSLMGPESDQESISIKAVGTVGYIDPEYYVMNTLTAKSDVYGLGIVLLELLTGKRAVFKDVGSSPIRVVDYAVPRIAAGELESVLDERVRPATAMNEAEAVEMMAYTALNCVNLEGKERPSISDVVLNLERTLALCEGSNSNTTFSVASH